MAAIPAGHFVIDGHPYDPHTHVINPLTGGAVLRTSPTARALARIGYALRPPLPLDDEAQPDAIADG